MVVHASQDTSSSFVEACRIRIPARASRPFNSRDLEVGNSAKLRSSAFGDGEGKWILLILSPHAPLEVTSLLTSRGLTSNVSR